MPPVSIRNVIFHQILRIKDWLISSEIQKNKRKQMCGHKQSATEEETCLDQIAGGVQFQFWLNWKCLENVADKMTFNS